MAKLLNTTFLVTQSAPATPSPGFGTLYASGSSLYFKNSSGVIYNLPIVSSSSISVYLGSSTWTKPLNIKYVKVVCAGGGGGGGSGRLGATATNRFGGGGGAGGSVNIVHFSSASLTPGSYTVTVGGGGAGGPAQITTAADGITGSLGSNSSFSSGSTLLVVGVGGNNGKAGTNTAGATGGTNTAPTTATVPNPLPPFYFSGTDGSAGFTTTVTTTANAFGGTRWLSGGGGGGGLTTANVSGSGGSGSAIYSYATLIQSGSPGIAGGSVDGQNGAPVIDTANLLYYSSSNLITGIKTGTGGHGGAGGTNSPASSGGIGGSGSLGAGGGGGAGATAAASISSGRGGQGGDGFVIIFEYY